MGREAAVRRSGGAWGFLLLLAIVLAPSFPRVTGQLRGGDAPIQPAGPGSPAAGVVTPPPVGNPYAPMRGAEGGQATEARSSQQAAGQGGGLRAQQTGAPANVQRATPGTQAVPPGNMQTISPANAVAGQPGNALAGQPGNVQAAPPANGQPGLTSNGQAWAPGLGAPGNPAATGSLRSRQPVVATASVPAVAPVQNQQQQQIQQQAQQQQFRQPQQQQLQPPRGQQLQQQQQQQVQQQQHQQPQQQYQQPHQQQFRQQQQQQLHQQPQQPPHQPPQQHLQQQQQPPQLQQQQPYQQQLQQQQPHQQQQVQQLQPQQQQQRQQRRQQRGGKWHIVGDPAEEDARPIGAGMAGRPTGMERGAVVLTDETFPSFIKSEPFALVLFYAPWCHWSRATLPEFDAVARFMAKVASRPIVLGKVNCDENPYTQKAEHILEYPIIKLYIDGKPKQYVGGRRRTQIFAWINHNLQRDERLDTIPHLDEFMRNGAEGHQLVIAVTTKDNADGSAGGDSALFDHPTFRHVARSFSDDVLFGEIHEPFALQHFLNRYVLPNSKTTPDMWVPPFIVTTPPDPADPPFVKYLGRGDDQKALERFVHKYRFSQVLAFEPDTIEDIFDDGRSICLLLLDGDRASKSLTREGLVDPIVAAFHDIAGEYREDLIFTIAGNKEAHERRIFNLMGVDETITSPVIRIATFNPSGNGKYYPAQKFKPIHPFKPGRIDAEDILAKMDPDGANTDRSKPTYSFRNRSPTHSLIVNALTTSAKAHNSLRSSRGRPQEAHRGDRHETTFDARQQYEQLEATKIIRDFAKAFLDGQLEPYTNSEPIPPASQNAGPVKMFVGLNFQAEVIDSPHDVFVSFGAPWCGHCRKLEPAFKRVAQIVAKRSSLVLGKIDATLNELDGINLSGYPTLLLFRAGSKQQPVLYDGDRSESDMLIWLARNAQHSKLNAKELTEDLRTLLTGGGAKESRRANTSVLEEL